MGIKKRIIGSAPAVLPDNDLEHTGKINRDTLLHGQRSGDVQITIDLVGIACKERDITGIPGAYRDDRWISRERYKRTETYTKEEEK